MLHLSQDLMTNFTVRKPAQALYDSLGIKQESCRPSGATTELRTEEGIRCPEPWLGNTCQVCVIGHKGVRALQLLHERVAALHNCHRAPLAHLWSHVLPWRRIHLRTRAPDTVDALSDPCYCGAAWV